MTGWESLVARGGLDHVREELTRRCFLVGRRVVEPRLRHGRQRLEKPSQRVVLPLGLAGSVEVGEYPIHELAELIAGLDDARRCVSWSALPLAHGRNRPTRSPARSSACPCKSCPADTRRKDSPRRSRGSQIRAPQSYAGHRSPGVGTTKQEGPHGARDAELART